MENKDILKQDWEVKVEFTSPYVDVNTVGKNVGTILQIHMQDAGLAEHITNCHNFLHGVHSNNYTPNKDVEVKRLVKLLNQFIEDNLTLKEDQLYTEEEARRMGFIRGRFEKQLLTKLTGK